MLIYIESFVVQQLKVYLLETDFDEVARTITDAVNSAAPDCAKEHFKLAEIEKKIVSGITAVLSGMDTRERQSEMDRLRARKSEREDIIRHKESADIKIDPIKVVNKFHQAVDHWEND